MSRIGNILCLLLFLSSLPIKAQVTNRDNYDIKIPKDLKVNCQRLLNILGNVPPDIRFSTEFKGDSIFLLHPDESYLVKIFEGKTDGAAIDLVQKEQYQCDNIHRFPQTWSHLGYLLPPIYRDDLMRRARKTTAGDMVMFVGKIPKSIRPDRAEANIILLDDRNFCSYAKIVNVDFHGWKLLETGLYYDTLTKEKLEERYRDLNKTLRFTIPFEKNKAEYNAGDIKPMYDSLRMTDYAIRTISIRAFTSVEGSYERNLALQQERTQSIVNALQSYQSEKIRSTVTASENWVEFLEDLSGSYPDLVVLDKAEIKEKLKSPELLSRLEPALKKHRKAIIEITLEKRLSYRESHPDELKKYFQQTIMEKNIEEALYLQQIIFQKIQRQEVPETFLDQLEVPQALLYGSLLINRASFLYDNQFSNLFEAIATFERLGRLLPGNAKIDYSLCALRLQSWVATNILVEPTTLKKEIEGLASRGIHQSLVRRLLINYHILLSEMFLQKRNYGEKDKALKSIYDNYKPLHMSDDDLVNLAKYFSHYSRFDWARGVIEPRINALDVSEDLVFYYLSLTIFNTETTERASYRATMLNAVNGNRARFCGQFEASGQGGISFQLLENPFLKRTFCENCNK